ncbi:MAG: TolC family protein [Candidatus Omnitrophica bacterium]|nr:TolC family protein [Candidatus Omnitrophota bacterium]
MIRRLLFVLIFTVVLCGAVFASDDAPAGREEISLESAKKERMAPISAQPEQESAPRVAIDITDTSLPKPASAEKIEAAAVLAPPVEKSVSASQAETSGLKSEATGEVKIITVAQPPVEAVQPLPRKKARSGMKFTMPWQTGPKKKLTEEEELDKKIQGRPFMGETGFTTVTTYRNNGIKASGSEAKAISAESVPVILSIDDCVKIAAANNIQALVAKKSIKLAEMRIFEARRNLLPTATIVVERTKGRVSGDDYLGRKQYIEGQQPIFHGGELYFAMKQAEANLQIAKNDYNRVKNELVLQVKKAYYTVEKAKENAVLQSILSREVEKMYGVSSKGYEAGAVAKVEYLNVSSQASQVKYQLVSAEGDVSIAELILRQAMNVNPREKFSIISSPEFKKVTLDFEKTLQDAFVNRPEIKANALMITYYDYGKGIANAKSLPKVDLLGQWGLAWEDYVSGSPGLVNENETSPRRNLQPQWYVGIKVGVPFAGNTAEYSYTREDWVPVVQTYQGTAATVNSFKFKILDKLDMFSDKQLADIDYDRSRQEMNKTKNDVTLEIREGCFNYEKAVIQLETASNKVKYQEADSELMRMKRGMDEVQDSNVVDSLIKVAQEKFGYVQAVTDCKTALASLEKAVGVEDYFRNK